MGGGGPHEHEPQMSLDACGCVGGQAGGKGQELPESAHKSHRGGAWPAAKLAV